MPVFRDQLGRKVQLDDVPKRIVSLVPSQTELLCDLGLSEKVVGRTSFCIHPEDKVRNFTSIGGTKNFDLRRISELNPDLIIANREENLREPVEELAGKYPVWVSDVSDLQDSLEMIRSVGEITGKKTEAVNLSDAIMHAFQQKLPNRGTALYFIWKEPWMVAGTDTFISAMMLQSGLKNVIGKHRYPRLDSGSMTEFNPDYILLSSEPYPFSEKHAEEMRGIFTDSKVMLVDGSFFSWYGSRLLQSAKYLQGVFQS